VNLLILLGSGMETQGLCAIGTSLIRQTTLLLDREAQLDRTISHNPRMTLLLLPMPHTLYHPTMKIRKAMQLVGLLQTEAMYFSAWSVVERLPDHGS